MSNSDFTSASVRPCIKCGAVSRNKKGDCKPCHKLMAAKWHAENKQKVSAKHSAWRVKNIESVKARQLLNRSTEIQRLKEAGRASKWREENPEKSKANSAAWYEANKDRTKENKAAWVLKNPDASKIAWENRRARKQLAGGILSNGLSAKLYQLQKGKCACCSQPLGANYHLDHIMPLALGGTNTDDNIQLLRQRCNSQKHARHPVDFMQSRGFLI